MDKPLTDLAVALYSEEATRIGPVLGLTACTVLEFAAWTLNWN